MNKLVRAVAMVSCVGVVLGLAGCGGPESEYEGLLDKAVELGIIDKKRAVESMDEFKAMTPEKQQEEIKQAKIWTAAAEAAK